MNFGTLSERYFSGSAADRAGSLIEFTGFSGRSIGAGETLQQSAFMARGDGMLEYRRRGDFMERGDAFPGVWTARCEPSELSEAWDKLGDLGPDSFPSRAADPGEGSSRLSACVSPLSETLSWGPPDHSRPAPGDAFMAALAPLIVKAQEGEPLWSVEMKPGALARTPRGLSVEVELINHGSRPIGFVLPMPAQGGGFKLRQAIAREVPADVTPLPVTWNWEDLSLPGQKSPALWVLEPGTPVRIALESEAELDSGRAYLGKLEYEQPVYLDRFIGSPILSGACFTPSFRFAL